MPTRFTILHHQISGGEHWDLLLEHGEVLLAWQLEREPVDPSSLPIPARRIADHRKLYLGYEGPINGDRGHVRRIDTGTVELEEVTGEKCLMALRGERLSGYFMLRKRGDEWVLAVADCGA